MLLQFTTRDISQEMDECVGYKFKNEQAEKREDMCEILFYMVIRQQRFFIKITHS